MSFPPATEMFQFAGFASRPYGFRSGSPCGGVAPFGDPGINDRSHLPRAFRSVPRPSSPLSAKASTRCPYYARFRHAQGQTPLAKVLPIRGVSHEDTLPQRRMNNPSRQTTPRPRHPSRSHSLFTLSKNTPTFCTQNAGNCCFPCDRLAGGRSPVLHRAAPALPRARRFTP